MPTDPHLSGPCRHWLTGEWITIRSQDGRIAAIEPAIPPETREEVWIAPAFWDIQVNGRWGISFSDPDLTVDRVSRIILAQASLGTARFCPTLISAPAEHTMHGLGTISGACEADPAIARRVLGIHLEGPYLSGSEGFRGAHPVECLRDPDWDEFRRWQDLAGGRIVLMTLAPERAGAIPFIKKAVSSGVVVAIGHTSANRETIRSAVDAGASLSTHLGNGIVSPLPRHPNPIFDQAGDDGLWASFIADGHHLDPSTLRVLARAKTAIRSILVSDASPLAGVPPGEYGPWKVRNSGEIVVSGTDYLAGSALGLESGVANLQDATGWTIPEVIATASLNPCRLLGRPEPRLSVGEPANLIRFRSRDGFQLLETIVDGVPSGPDG